MMEHIEIIGKFRDDLYAAHLNCDIEKIKIILIDINKNKYDDNDIILWQKYYLARAHTLLSDSYFKGKSEELAYNHARSAVDALSGLGRQPSADAEIYALLGGALGRTAAGASDPVSKASIGMRSDRAIAMAIDADPRNPRALVMHGRSLLLKPRLFGGNKKSAIRTLSEARELALNEPPPPAPLPNWGLEEACFWLAYGLLHFNRFDEAREALEPLFRKEVIYYLARPMLVRIDEKEKMVRHG